MWKEIKAVWAKQWNSAKDAWKCAWDGCKDSLCNALYAVANFIWAVIQTVVFLPFKTGLYETGAIIVKHLVALIKKI